MSHLTILEGSMMSKSHSMVNRDFSFYSYHSTPYSNLITELFASHVRKISRLLGNTINGYLALRIKLLNYRDNEDRYC